MDKPVIELLWRPNFISRNKQGCWEARLKDRQGIYDLGLSEEEAISEFLITAKTHELSGNQEDYEVVIVDPKEE